MTIWIISGQTSMFSFVYDHYVNKICFNYGIYFEKCCQIVIQLAAILLENVVKF